MEQIVRDELMVKRGHLIDPRQHSFLKNRSCSCTNQLVDFCDSLSLSLNSNIRSNVIYFDFSKALARMPRKERKERMARKVFALG